MTDKPLAIVLAAGKGTRMKSEEPKVLLPVCGQPMVRYVVKALRGAGVERIVVVVGFRGDRVREELAGEVGVTFVEQREQRGTGHAVMVCREELEGHSGPVVVVAGDSPMLQASSLRALLDEFRERESACLIGTAQHENPQGLGRIVRNAEGEFEAIVEQRDATDEQRQITEVNMSTYVFAAADLMHSLDALTTDNAQAEYYITDCPGILKREGRPVRAEAVLKSCEALSINTPEELAVVEAEMRRLRDGS